MKKLLSLLLFGLVAISLTGCDNDSPTAVEANGSQLLMNGRCAARQADMSITCQDESTVTGKDAAFDAIIFDFRLGGVSRATLKAGLGLPPRQVSSTGLDPGTWSVIHTVRAHAGNTLLENERTYVATLLAASTVQALLEKLELIGQFERGDDLLLEPTGENTMRETTRDQRLRQEVTAMLALLPPTTREAARDYVRRRHGGVDLETASADELRVAIEAQGGLFGLRTALRLMQIDG